MKKIKTLFKQFTLTNEFDKILLKLNTSEDYLRPTEDVILKVKDALEGNNLSNVTKERATSELFQSFTTHSSWIQSLKLLYLIHKMIRSMRLNVTQHVMENDISNQIKSTLFANTQAEEVFIPIAIKYATFLEHISKHFSQVYLCEQFYSNEDIGYLSDSATQQILDTLAPLIKILKNILRVQKNLSFGLQTYQKYEISKSIGEMIIKESIMIYDFISCVMSKIKDRILTEEAVSSLKIYEVYEEVVILTKDIEKLYNLRNFTIDPCVKRPQYFKIDKENNQKIELHINKLNKIINNSDNVRASINKSISQIQGEHMNGKNPRSFASSQLIENNSTNELTTHEMSYNNMNSRSKAINGPQETPSKPLQFEFQQPNSNKFSIRKSQASTVEMVDTKGQYESKMFKEDFIFEENNNEKNEILPNRKQIKPKKQLSSQNSGINLEFDPSKKSEQVRVGFQEDEDIQFMKNTNNVFEI